MTETTETVRSGAKIGVLVLAFVVAFLLAEGSLRLWWSNPYGDSAHMIVELRTQPKNVSRRIDRSPIDGKNPVITFRTNARGYIEPSARFDKPDYTVAFLGGSTTECLFVDEDLRFPARASFLLERNGIKANVLNAGYSGNDSHQSINNLLNYVVTDKPDIAVLMEAANDIGHLDQMGGYEFAMGNVPTLATQGRLLFTKAASHSYVLGLVRHVKLLLSARDLLSRAQRVAGAEKQSDDDSHERNYDVALRQFKQRLRVFIGIARGFGITPVLMTQPSAGYRNELTPGWIDQSAQARFNQAIRDVAAAEHADLIDLVAFIQVQAEPTGTFKQPVFYDAIHVTDYGSSIYAEHIAERLEQILRAR